MSDRSGEQTTDHYLLVVEVMEEVAVSKETMQIK
jgi:hypothetical protein